MEQYRRAQFDFDAQSVRPYFPYTEVQAGILATASRLFHVSFKPVKNRRCGIHRSILTMCTTRLRATQESCSGAFILTCIRAQGRTSGSPRRRWSRAFAAGRFLKEC